MTDKKEIKSEPFHFDGHFYQQQGPGAYRAFDSSAIQQTHQLFPSDEFNSGPIFMTLPNLGVAPMPSSLDEPDVFRSVTGMQEQTGYWASANQGTQGTQGKELFGTSHWNVRPVPMPVPEPKKLDALSNLVPRLASLNLSAPQPEIPELPEYVERFSSFVSTEAPTAVFGAILGYFGQAKVDYECESQRKLKMTGIAYENGTPVTFKVKIFRHKRDSNRCVVEFQRRSGCVVAFTSFYRRTLQALGSMVQCLYADDLAASIKQQTGSGAASNLIVPSMSFSGATTAASGPGQIVLDDNSVQNLLDMCLTESADVKREALRVLANASGLETNQQVLTSIIKTKAGQSIDIPARVVEVITASLPSADREIGRCASLLLANLSQASVTFRGRLLPLIATFFTVLQRLAEPAATTVGGLLNKEIKRQVSKTLLLVSQSNLRDLKAPSSLSARRELLQHLSKDTDPQVKLNVVATLQAMADTKPGRNF